VKIIEVRRTKRGNEDDFVSVDKEERKEETLDVEMQEPGVFDYYVHYMGQQRRNDRWCFQDELKLDEA
jgi:histone acetyltransferase MYST1